MKDSLRIPGLLLAALGSLLAQTPAASPVLSWDTFADHPANALVSAAPPLTATTLSLMRQANQWQLDLGALARIPALAKTAQACLNAKDEFERKRLETSLKAELQTAARQVRETPYHKLVLSTQLGSYAFNTKSFTFKGDGTSYLRNDLVRLSAPEGWPVFPVTLPVAEGQAEQWVKQHPSRRITVVVLVPTHSISMRNDRPGSPGIVEAEAMFTAFFWNDDPDKPLPVIAAYPYAAALSEMILAKVAANLEGNRDSRNALSADVQNRAWAGIGEHARMSLLGAPENLLAEAARAGFKLKTDPKVAQAMDELKKVQDRRRIALGQLIKVGRDYQGTQFLANGVQRPIVLRFNKGDSKNGWTGTCIYPNKRKAIVLAGVGECSHGPGLSLCFYTPQDDEIGAGEGEVFHVVGNQAFGLAMPETLLYHTDVRTRFIFQ